MLMAIIADAVFCAAFFVETLALISILQAIHRFELHDALVPIMRFYHEKTAHLAGASLFGAPAWFPDAAIIAAVLFFTFFIAQTRTAMAPYGAPQGLAEVSAKTSRVDAAIDLVLPAAICAIGAGLAAPTLLPFLTLPFALWLLLKRLAGKPSWFEVSRVYYLNVALLAGLAAAISALTR